MLRAITGSTLAVVLFLSASHARARDDDEPKFDKAKLIGKWEPVKPSEKKGERITMEYKKAGKVVVTFTVDDKDLPLEGTWKLMGDKLDVTISIDGKDVTTTFVLKKLDEKSLEYLDPRDKKEIIKLKRSPN